MAADGTPGTKGNPHFLGSGAPATAADMNLISDWAADENGRSVATAAGLPASGNWPGRCIYVIDEDRCRVWSGTAWSTALGDTTWVTPSLGTNWAVNSVAPRYRRINGIVYFEGRGNSTAATTSSAFVLAAGFRPGNSRVFSLDAGGTVIRSQVTGAGVVGPVTAAILTALSFDGIAPFPADA